MKGVAVLQLQRFSCTRAKSLCFCAAELPHMTKRFKCATIAHLNCHFGTFAFAITVNLESVILLSLELLFYLHFSLSMHERR